MGRVKGREGRVSVIYVDTLFVVNGVLDYLLLLGGAKLAGQPLNRGRFALGALIGGSYAVAVVLPGLRWLAGIPGAVAALAIMAFASYGGTGKALRQTGLFLFLSAAFAGSMAAMGMTGTVWYGGRRFYLAPEFKTVLLCACALYAAASLLLERVGRHTAASGELGTAVFCLKGQQKNMLALFDSGNTLCDPVTGRPAVVVEWEMMAPLFPEEPRPGKADLLDPVRAMERLGGGEWSRRFRLLAYRSVGVERGLLLAVRTDWIEINGVRQEGALAALSPTPVSAAGRYHALVGEWKGEMT